MNFSAKVIASPSHVNAGIQPQVKRKIFLSAGERIFPLQPCQIVPAAFGCRKNHPGGRKQAKQREIKNIYKLR
ncbi:hypothetical protein ACIXP9_02370 [Bacteroides fragilis]